MLLYVDTNVYLDYLLERENRAGDDLSNVAFQLFKRAADCEFRIVLSDAVLLELRSHIEPHKTTSFFTFLERKLDHVRTTAADRDAARRINTHQADALHIVLARKAGADILVTRNITDFSGHIETELPEHI